MAAILADAELAFLAALVKHDVPFMVAGASAAVLQGAPIVTQDIKLWFQSVDDPKMKAAVKDVSGVFVSSFGHNPPSFAGRGLELFDIVINPQGLGSFDDEYPEAIAISLGTVTVPVLPLERIIVSKRAAGRDKDKAALPDLETALKTISEVSRPKKWSDVFKGRA